MCIRDSPLPPRSAAERRRSGRRPGARRPVGYHLGIALSHNDAAPSAKRILRRTGRNLGWGVAARASERTADSRSTRPFDKFILRQAQDDPEHRRTGQGPEAVEGLALAATKQALFPGSRP